MIGYVIVSSGDEVYSNGINKSLDDVKEDVLYRKIDEYFMLDVMEGRFVSSLNDVHGEADFDIAVDGYIEIAEWVISVDIDTNDVDIFHHGILIDRRNK